MSIEPIEMLQATADTFLMVGVATVVACFLGLPLGFLVVVTSVLAARGADVGEGPMGLAVWRLVGTVLAVTGLRWW